VHSWDLFDTLVAARPLSPAGDHISTLYRIAEIVSRVAPDDIVVSDYYNLQNAEYALREVAGLSNQLILTDSDKWNGSIWPRLSGVSHHHGDNPVADFQRPKEHGIEAELIELSKPTIIETYLISVGMQGLALCCREARLKTTHSGFRELQLLQVQANFPLLVLAAVELHQYVVSHGIQRVLMCSRDCCLWVRLQHIVCERLGGEYTMEYIPSSRICSNVPTANYLHELNTRLDVPTVIVDVGGTGKSLSRLVARSVAPNTRIFLLTRYSWVDIDAYGPIDLTQVHSFLDLSNNTMESVNVATHNMYVDWDTQLPTSFDWNREEVRVMHEAFLVACDALQHYPIPNPSFFNKEVAAVLFQKVNNDTAYHLDFLRPGIVEAEKLRMQYEEKGSTHNEPIYTTTTMG
jgi:hypothetical protein